MSYIQGSMLEKVTTDSMEYQMGLIQDYIQEEYNDELNIIATFSDYLIAFHDGKPRKISFSMDESGDIKIISDRACRSLKIIEDEDIPIHVARELKVITKSILEGDVVSRTRVRELIPFIREEDDIWISDVISKIDESIIPNTWSRMYDANIERVRTSLYGKIRELSGNVPRTRYSKLPEDRIQDFESEIRESIGIIKKCYKNVIESCKEIQNHGNDFLGAVCESLNGEAQALVGLLEKAEKLLGKKDLPIIAKTHDRLADRARSMILVAEYVKAKMGSNNNKE